MKHLILLVAGFVLIFTVSVFAANGISATPAKTEPSKAVTVKPPKETKVSITGVVKEFTDTMIMVERTVKGKTELMEFALDKPVEKIKAGDKVKVSYIKKDGKNMATRVIPTVAKKITKKAPPREIKPSPTETPQPQK
jgi:ribosomal protein S1